MRLAEPDRPSGGLRSGFTIHGAWFDANHGEGEPRWVPLRNEPDRGLHRQWEPVDWGRVTPGYGLDAMPASHWKPAGLYRGQILLGIGSFAGVVLAALALLVAWWLR